MKKDRPRYAGRIEYLAMREQIKALLEKGYSLAMAFRELSGAGKITMSYEQFTKYASGRARNVLPIYSPQKANKEGDKKSIRDSSPQKHVAACVVSLQENTEKITTSSASPNIVKVDEKHFGAEIKTTEIY